MSLLGAQAQADASRSAGGLGAIGKIAGGALGGPIGTGIANMIF